MKKQYTFLLNYGYAESQTLYSTPFTSREKFSDAKAALLDLAKFFKERFLDHHGVKLKKCCLKAKEASEEGTAFCPKCGRSLADEDFDAEGFIDFVREVGRYDTDSYSANCASFCEDDWAWEPGDGPNVRNVLTAEKVMAAAIGHSPDDRVTIERIFKERTGSKSETFSFW